MVSKNWILRNPTFKVRIFTLKTQNQQKLELGMSKVWLGYYIPSLILFWKTKREFKEWVSMRKIRRWLLESKCKSQCTIWRKWLMKKMGFVTSWHDCFYWFQCHLAVLPIMKIPFLFFFPFFFHLRIKKKIKYTYIPLWVISKHH